MQEALGENPSAPNISSEARTFAVLDISSVGLLKGGISVGLYLELSSEISIQVLANSVKVASALTQS